MLTGVLLGFAASVSWALANVAVQRASQAIGPYRALLWAQVPAVAAIAAWVAISAGPGQGQGQGQGMISTFGPLSAATAAWIAVAGVSGLLAYVCLFYAFAHGRLTLAVPIMSSWAVLSSALSLVLLDQRLAVGQLVGAAAVIAGAVVVSRHAHKESAAADAGAAAAGGPRSSAPRWLLASIGAAVGFGVLIPAMSKLSPTFGSVTVIGVAYLADLVLGVPLALAFGIGLAAPAGRAWWPVLLAGLFETLGFACITIGARLAPLALVSPLASLAAALTVLYAWAILGERPSRGVLVGAVLVCAGVVVLAL